MLKEKLLEDLKNSMKEKNINRKNVIQMVRAGILQKEKDNLLLCRSAGLRNGKRI